MKRVARDEQRRGINPLYLNFLNNFFSSGASRKRAPQGQRAWRVSAIELKSIQRYS